MVCLTTTTATGWMGLLQEYSSFEKYFLFSMRSSSAVVIIHPASSSSLEISNNQ